MSSEGVTNWLALSIFFDYLIVALTCAVYVRQTGGSFVLSGLTAIAPFAGLPLHFAAVTPLKKKIL